MKTIEISEEEKAIRMAMFAVMSCIITLAIVFAEFSGYAFALYLTDAPQYQSIDLTLFIACMIFAISFGIIVLGLRAKEDRSSNSNHLMPKL